jgi:hypothetical protein
MTQIDLPSGWSPVGKDALAANGSTFSLAPRSAREDVLVCSSAMRLLLGSAVRGLGALPRRPVVGRMDSSVVLG